MSKLNKVLYDVDQSADTSAAERILARKNVGLDFDTEWTRGSAGGLATLDSSGLVPAEQLPSYVDDVIEGYYRDEKFYSDSAHAHEIAGELNKIYIDITVGANNASYRYTESGSYIQISAQNTFSKISVDKGDEDYDNVTADAVSDTVTLDRGTGIALDVDGKHITVGHTNSVAAGTAGSKEASTGNETLEVPWVDFDSEGHVTGNGTHTHTISTATNAKTGVVTLTDTIGSQDAATGGLGLSPKAVHSLGGAIYAAQYYNGADNEVTVRLFDIKLVDHYANTVIRGQVTYTYTYNQADCYGIGNFELVVSYNPNGSTKFNVLGNKTYWTSQGHVHDSTPEFRVGYLFDQATLKLAVYAVHIRRYHFCGINVTQATCEHDDMRKAMTFVSNPHAETIPAGMGYLDNVDGLPTKVTAWSNTVSDANVPSEKLVKDTIDNLGGSASSSPSNNVKVTVNTSHGEVTSVSVTDNSVNSTDVSNAIATAVSGLPTKVTSWSSPLSDDKIPSEKLVKDTIDNLGGSASSSSSNNVRVTVNTSGGKVSSVSVTDNSVNASDVATAISNAIVPANIVYNGGGVSEVELDGDTEMRVAPDGWVDAITGLAIVEGGTAEVPRKKLKLTRVIQNLTDQRPRCQFVSNPVFTDYSGTGGVVPGRPFTNIPANDSTYTEVFYTVIGHRSYKEVQGDLYDYEVDAYGLGPGPGRWLVNEGRRPVICRVHFNYRLVAPSPGASWVDFDVCVAVSGFSIVRFKDNDTYASIRSTGTVSGMCFSASRYWYGDMELIFPLQPDDYTAIDNDHLYVGFRPVSATMPEITPDAAGHRYVAVGIYNVTITYE